MGPGAWFTLAVIFVAVAAMVRGTLPPAGAIFAAAVALLVAGVTEPDEALAGFSNPAPFTIAALFVLARAVENTGALSPVVAAMLSDRDGRALVSGVRLLVPTALSSAFLNNTSIVAMLTPAVSHWSERRGVTASRYLMPLSFAAILGGTLTVIGTSTNVAVSGLLADAGHDPIALFEVGKLGLPLALVGLVLLVALAPRLLPKRAAPRSSLASDAREFVLDMVVEPAGAFEGIEVERGGLRHLRGVYLAQIERGASTITPVAPTTTLRGGDVLRFVGRADDVVDLQAMAGLRSSEDGHVGALGRDASSVFEVVLGQSSPVVGTTIRASEFRGRYQAAVVAVHRAGQRIEAKLGDVRLRVGDTLLLIADPEFGTRWAGGGDFLLISGVRDLTTQQRRTSSLLVGAIAIGVVVLAASDVLSLLEASLLAALTLVGTGVLTPTQARSAVDLDVVITIASAFGLAAGVQQSGLGDELATGIVEVFDGLGSRGVLLGIVLATILLTELVTNSAAAVLMFPIALSAAAATGLDPRGTAIAVAVSASASFLTPIGYQTNMMVYGPGGYRFLDYARLGAPLTLAVIVIVVLATPEFW
ncbi:MAG: SLC13 family permease [Chloroflexi bacterium]|nr:SLC13 family permease [Chloroflexota bacterium]